MNNIHKYFGISGPARAESSEQEEIKSCAGSVGPGKLGIIIWEFTPGLLIQVGIKIHSLPGALFHQDAAVTWKRIS